MEIEFNCLIQAPEGSFGYAPAGYFGAPTLDRAPPTPLREATSRIQLTHHFLSKNGADMRPRRMPLVNQNPRCGLDANQLRRRRRAKYAAPASMTKPTRPVSKSGDGPGTGAVPAMAGPQNKREATSRISWRAIFSPQERLASVAARRSRSAAPPTTSQICRPGNHYETHEAGVEIG